MAMYGYNLRISKVYIHNYVQYVHDKKVMRNYIRISKKVASKQLI